MSNMNEVFLFDISFSCQYILLGKVVRGVLIEAGVLNRVNKVKLSNQFL